ncbi:hypothetical protein GXM_09285 [Nostoc sphaeroides CCNUC1]|uniref:Uncharacterized protein n=1 Tax=Nostoc sphaeroides CCNUC1 TaxID=2653204 RepID=A0A5P8WGR7_9NOSO|nr:hypothetical protein GXM_09285 [Nostoc sphaeroides CCNUC1]
MDLCSERTDLCSEPKLSKLFQVLWRSWAKQNRIYLGLTQTLRFLAFLASWRFDKLSFLALFA